MSSFKKLKAYDLTTVPRIANKQWDVDYVFDDNPNEYVTIYKGTNITSSFNIHEPILEGQYERLVYHTINHMFYQAYSGSLDTSSLANSFNYISSSGERPTGSYFNYNDNALIIKNFPTGTYSNITVLAIKQDIFGSKILPYYFNMSSSIYNIIDDGFGNLLDNNTLSQEYVYPDYVLEDYIEGAPVGDIYIGNIFYAHGLAVITHYGYQAFFLPSYFDIEGGSTYFIDSGTPYYGLN